MVITIAQPHSRKPERRFCAGSNPVRDVLEICSGKDLWLWAWLEIRNTLRQSNTPQKRVIIVIIIVNSMKTYANKILPENVKSINTYTGKKNLSSCFRTKYKTK